MPALQAGVAKDFDAGTTAWLYSLSVRSYAWWHWGKHRFGLGNRLLDAGQHIESADKQTCFMLLESGFEWDHLVPWKLGGHELSASLYIMWQHYADDAELEVFAGEEVNLIDLYKLDVTFGFRDAVTILRFIPCTGSVWPSAGVIRSAAGRSNRSH